MVSVGVGEHQQLTMSQFNLGCSLNCKAVSVQRQSEGYTKKGWVDNIKVKICSYALFMLRKCVKFDFIGVDEVK